MSESLIQDLCVIGLNVPVWPTPRGAIEVDGKNGPRGGVLASLLVVLCLNSEVG